ncbi:MAG: penicillin-binding transpeptidase domain-containing protein, partial [Candidatus Omnitrophica bacterium]|nr:penicillin-binding transpeptidase domain-containing protein [Candidatus Omnitrophota bacterium]
MRIKFFKLILYTLFIFLGVYIFYLQVLRGPYYRQLSKHNSIRIIPEEGARGRIFDRNFNVLVDNYLSFDVFILTQHIKEKDKTLAELSSILNISEGELRQRLNKRYIAPFLPVNVAQNLDRKQAIRIEMYNYQLPGVILRARPRRHYPYGKLASQVIGYLSEIDYWRLEKLKDYGYKARDIVGYAGVEERYDYYLRPTEGGLQVEVDSRGRFKRALGYKYSLNGKDIQLTLDINLQKIVEENLAGNKGAVILMDPSTGEILAMASFPDFNPEIFFERSPLQLQKIFNDPDAPLLNRGISASYPPGS